MSSKWHESIDEERRQADLTAQGLGQQGDTSVEADVEPGVKHIEDIREFALEVSTAFIEPQREPNTELSKKIQQHFDEQKPSHTRRYAEMNTKTLLKSKTTWLMLAACVYAAAVPLGMHWFRQSQLEVAVVDNTARETAEEGPWRCRMLQAVLERPPLPQITASRWSVAKPSSRQRSASCL